MKEDFLHFVWEHSLFNLNGLTTTCGLPIVISKKGYHNFSSGPDFQEAILTIDDVVWAGSVELHVSASDWVRHKHTSDSNYDNVVLHVVYEADQEIQAQDGHSIPCLELKGRIHSHVLRKYDELKDSMASTPCARQIKEIETIVFQSWFDHILVQRLERKCSDIDLIFSQSEKDWSQTFYALILAYLGQDLNKLAMLDVAFRLPYRLLAKHADDTRRVEACLLGVAGFLSDSQDDPYFRSLKSEYGLLREKYQLSETKQQWRLGRVRPENSPLRRLIQFTNIMPRLHSILADLLVGRTISFREEGFRHTYWERHYSFGKPSKRILSMYISDKMNDMLVINAVAPFLFFHADTTGAEHLKERALSMLGALSSEDNRYVRTWKNLGVDAKNASDSQAMIELTTQYCSLKKCLNCNIGKAIIAPS